MPTCASWISTTIALTLFFVPPGAEAQGATFRVTLAEETRQAPAVGRLLVFLVHEGAEVSSGAEPVEGPFWGAPQPIFGRDVRLAPGEAALIDDSAEGFPVRAGALEAGKYRAQARFDLAHLDSNWRREPGNLWSKAVAFEVGSGPAKPVELRLDQVVASAPARTADGVEWFEQRSELLSQFRGHDVVLHAGVVLPKDYDSKRRYPAVYEVPGFGGNHLAAAGGRRRSAEEGAALELTRTSFRIVLDPEGPNGHTLFADSENNGPCGAALVRELVPALEAKYSLIAEPSARLLRGHSSGGWSTLWLALNYPEVFGATWSSAPDPVDFRRFQRVDIYGQENFYTDADGDLPSLRKAGSVTMTIRTESRGEDILGPDNTSGQQWDSWFATFGPRSAHGTPAALFSPVTGAIDPAVAETYRAFDIGARLRTDPAALVPLFRERVRLIVGTEDSFYLNEAVELLQQELAKHPHDPSDVGYVKLVPGDHGSIFASEVMRAIPGEMLAHLRRAGHNQAGD